VIAGIDAEWQTSAERDHNQVLSCQWFGLDGEREWSGVHYPEDDKRLTISLVWAASYTTLSRFGVELGDAQETAETSAPSRWCRCEWQ